MIFDDETYEWVFAFTGGRTLRLSSHWRLASANQIIVGSEDEGQRFGLDTEVDVKQVQTILAGLRAKHGPDEEE